MLKKGGCTSTWKGKKNLTSSWFKCLFTHYCRGQKNNKVSGKVSLGRKTKMTSLRLWVFPSEQVLLHLRPFPAIDEVVDAEMVGQILHRRIIVHPVAVRVQRGYQYGRVGALPGHALPAVGQCPPALPGAVVPLPGPRSLCGGGRQQWVDAGHEASETRAVFRGGRRRRLGLSGGRRAEQAGRGRAEQTATVWQLLVVRATTLVRFDRQRAAAVVSCIHVRASLPLPPEVAVVEHLLTVGVQRPVVPFACDPKKERVKYGFVSSLWIRICGEKYVKYI